MPFAPNELAEAVYVFKGNRIIREMLYPEFEAILDGYVPIPDFANKQVKGVYVRINSRFFVAAAVFFYIEFDAEGFPDRRWNIPLAQLADTAKSGPDLGAGAIALACASQCAIEWHQPKLWDPSMASGKNNFAMLKKSVKANRLGLIFKAAQGDTNVPNPVAQASMDTASARALKEKYETEVRTHVAQLLKEQRFRMGVQKNQFQEQVDTLKSEHQSRLARYQERLAERDKDIENLRLLNAQLKERMESQMVKMDGIREYFEHKLKSAQSGEKESIESLRKQYELEMQLKVEAATSELEDMIQMRDMELMYRNEQESSLNEEVARLRDEVQNLVSNSGNEVLSHLQERGINFVAYQPGAGHITIPVADLTAYTENPQDYAAQKCGLTPVQYRTWLVHYQNPSCCALNSDGSVCSAPIDRVHNPNDFHPGENDRCATHRTAIVHAMAASS
ncbi:hypothetical protein QWY82_12015 [Simiduia curdlanivorans]|uniref:Chromosome partitioning protein ParA n=1 Tax=Simiduia curdlanivorans TaxID=1492769 RepID=A0ABV8VAC0_9GAMM|nr:hypothetical protein [Simiduia curdlanivorans]MDN3639522.1 hypothetical protein [Simiduia curdlanivorans]